MRATGRPLTSGGVNFFIATGGDEGVYFLAATGGTNFFADDGGVNFLTETGGDTRRVIEGAPFGAPFGAPTDFFAPGGGSTTGTTIAPRSPSLPPGRPSAEALVAASAKLVATMKTLANTGAAFLFCDKLPAHEYCSINAAGLP